MSYCGLCGMQTVFNGQGFLSAWRLLKLRVLWPLRYANCLQRTGFLVSLTFVEVESKHLGHIARADHFFNLCFEWKVAHLSVWCCLNLTGNDAVSCNVNLNFRILFPQWSYSTNDSPSTLSVCCERGQFITVSSSEKQNFLWYWHRASKILNEINGKSKQVRMKYLGMTVE